MDTLLTAEQAELESYCRRLLENEWPLEKALKALGPGGPRHSPELYAQLAEAGWLGLPFSSEYGGADGDLVDLGLIYRAAGEVLVPSSFYSTVFAALLIDRLGTPEQKQTLLPALISGEKLATVAYSEPHASEAPHLFKTTALPTAGGCVLEGEKAFVANAGTADVVLVLAQVKTNAASLGWGVFAVRKAALEGKVQPTGTIGGEAVFRIKLDRLAVDGDALLGGEAAVGSTLAAFEDVVETATALQCMEMVGGVQSVLKRTVEYVSQREQFGKPIGSYQAVQQLLANVGIALDGARVAALQAIHHKSKGRPAPREVSIAKMTCGETYVNCQITAAQVWGSMGYATETGLYLWHERARVTDTWFGTRAHHTRKLAALMGLKPAAAA